MEEKEASNISDRDSQTEKRSEQGEREGDDAG